MTFRRNQVVGLTLFGIVLFGLGLTFTLVGIKAIRERYWTTTSTVTTSVFLPFHSKRLSTTFVETWKGGTAQLLGAGLASFGLMLAVWALGCFSIVIQPVRKKQPGVPSILSAILFGLSVVLLAPPWRFGQSPTLALLWGSVAFWMAAGFVALLRRRWAKRILLPLFIATVMTEVLTPPELSGGTVLGLLAAGGIFVHGLYLYPPWRHWAVNRDHPNRVT